MLKSPLSPEDFAELLFMGCQGMAGRGSLEGFEGNFQECIGLVKEHLKTIVSVGGLKVKVSTHAAQTLWIINNFLEEGGLTFPKEEPLKTKEPLEVVDYVKQLLSNPKTANLVRI